jgi:hypothetical protein
MLGFAYGSAAVGSRLIYAAAGFAAARGGPIRLGALAGAAAAVIEGTLGWAIAWWIGPGRVQGDEAAPAALAATVIVVVGIGAAPHTPVYGK